MDFAMQNPERELRRRVDEVLYYVWDPIGVSDSPYARGEYRGYVPEILRLVETNEDMRPISDRLAQIVREYMEIAVDKARCDEAATLLLQHKDAVGKGRA